MVVVDCHDVICQSKSFNSHITYQRFGGDLPSLLQRCKSFGRRDTWKINQYTLVSLVLSSRLWRKKNIALF